MKGVVESLQPVEEQIIGIIGWKVEPRPGCANELKLINYMKIRCGKCQAGGQKCPLLHFAAEKVIQTGRTWPCALFQAVTNPPVSRK